MFKTDSLKKLNKKYTFIVETSKFPLTWCLQTYFNFDIAIKQDKKLEDREQEAKTAIIMQNKLTCLTKVAVLPHD